MSDLINFRINYFYPPSEFHSEDGDFIYIVDDCDYENYSDASSAWENRMEGVGEATFAIATKEEYEENPDYCGYVWSLDWDLEDDYTKFQEFAEKHIEHMYNRIHTAKKENKKLREKNKKLRMERSRLIGRVNVVSDKLELADQQRKNLLQQLHNQQ
jgi:hypothetical protein